MKKNMNNDNLLNIDSDMMEKNMVALIEDEDTNYSGASTPEWVSAISTGVTAVSSALTVSSACTKRCLHW